MFKILKYILTGALVSMYFFPFEFMALPGVNTKMVEAALGVVFFIAYLVKIREFRLPKSIFVVILLSCIVSLVGLFSVTFNQTEDYTYATYIVSALVWMGGAFFVCRAIHFVHGRIDIPLVVNYLIVVCVFQCAMAMLIEYVPAIQIAIDSTIRQGQTMLKEMHRLYGVGASLDIAGSRFSVVLVAIVILLTKHSPKDGKLTAFGYYFAFFIILIIGNMIARTTLVGVALGILYLCIFLIAPNHHNNNKSWLIGSLLSVMAIFVPLSVFLYETVPSMNELFRFAFEGFFSMAEEGQWEVSSTTKLETMIVFPETLKTWVIGDGYFLNSRYDINYLGNSTVGGYYMGTDIGYLRFIFYFGVIGLSSMIAVMAYSAVSGAVKNREYSMIPFFTFLVGMIVWFKVSTDVFIALILFLVVVEMQFSGSVPDSTLSKPSIKK